MRTLKLDDYLAEGERLFGKDRKKWKFICPQCKTIQSYSDFIEAEVSPEDIPKYLGFSCIGRFTEGKKGCDWTLGGLFQIHELEVLHDDKKSPRFEFAQ